MELVIGLILVVASVFLVGYPLIKKDDDYKALDRTLDFDAEDSLERQKESAFTTLGEIEFDYRMKKLSTEDYDRLKAKYKRQAVAVLKAEEKELDLTGDREMAELEKELEREIEQEIEREVQQLMEEEEKEI
ncbi:hypothetical protein MFMK1_000491 [Metallumcola ferriviriculae]|uniref:C-type cytochrome biogenesis protein CcmI n=1 Tax=Metallumcola ferriviriculae TaxID=3039180 RepID=A0AAU0UJZ2_9FIRM|nr:hypothetical protein MFMK1_000491 [Desulfitibacteraceae bacterium MK1]